jgi:anaerobic carbon-monoxide dehydrogenase iron sulfur subunit
MDHGSCIMDRFKSAEKRAMSVEGIIAVNPERCTNCKVCEFVCSVRHDGKASVLNSRIRIQAWKDVGAYFPVVCQNCEKPACIEICPTKARIRVEKTGAVITNTDICVGCKSCIYACPFAAPSINPDSGKTMTCDLCDGDPLCVRFCVYRAISYVPVYKVAENRKRAHSGVIKKALKAI